MKLLTALYFFAHTLVMLLVAAAIGRNIVVEPSSFHTVALAITGALLGLVGVYETSRTD